MYFDFDAFDEVAVNTGGNDLKVQTGGVGINFVTRRGTNKFKRQREVHRGQLEPRVDQPAGALVGDPRLLGADKANHTDFIRDWGFDIGGPILKDRLWFWGSYGDNDIKIIRLNQTTDETMLKNTERQGELVGDAEGRDVVLLLQRREGEARTLARPGRHRGRFVPLEPGQLLSAGRVRCIRIHGLVEDRGQPHLRSEPVRQREVRVVRLGLRLRAARRRRPGRRHRHRHRSRLRVVVHLHRAQAVADRRRQRQLRSRPRRRGNHEFKFGFGYRRNPNHSTTRWSGSEVVAHVNPDSDNFALAYRARVVNYIGQYTDAFIGDNFTRGRLTVDGGIRWDKQTAVERRQHAHGQHDVPGPAAVARPSTERRPTMAGTTSRRASARPSRSTAERKTVARAPTRTTRASSTRSK